MRSSGENVLDLAAQGDARVTMFFGLVGRLTQAWSTGEPWPNLTSLGRFSNHFESAASIMPRVIWSKEYADATLSVSTPDGDGESFSDEDVQLIVSVAVSPRGDVVLILDYAAGQPLAGETIGVLLAKTCFERKQLRIDGEPVLDLIRTELEGAHGSESLDWGTHVHQCVWADQHLFDLLAHQDLRHPAILPAELMEITYRGTLMSGTTQRLGVRSPEPLNIRGSAFAAHGRGVTVLGGWSLEVQNALKGTCLMMIISLGVLRHAKLTAFEALEIDERTSAMSATAARALVVNLSRTLDNLLLDLCFGVEAYVDSSLIPELVVESYQKSLSEAVGIRDALENTSRMLDRLSAVIGTRSSRLDIATQSREELKERVTSFTIAFASLLALPPALLLAFFGVNSPDVIQTRSILDLEVYWRVYLICWVPFILLTVTALLLRRRIRHSVRDS